MLKIEEGKYYKTRDGRKVGPAKSEGRKYLGQDAFEVPGPHPSVHLADGTYSGRNDTGLDLIAEWTDGPVVTETVTKTRIVPGVYGKVSVGEIDVDHENKFVKVQLIGSVWINADELDAAAAVLSALAKGLRDA